jgi:serine/threonine-protein kinase RsbW
MPASRGDERQKGSRGRCLRIVKITPQLDQLADARALIGEVASEAGLDEEQTYNLKVAVSEACANAMEHSGSREQIALCAWLQEDRLRIEIRHPGDFRLARGKATDSHRGLGLPLMVALMDEVKIHRLPEGGTLVTLSLFLP